jgi:opacity protein-like surface antigen
MKKLFLVVLLFALSACAFAQQDYVGRYDFYTGYSYLDSPDVNLSQRGFNTQIGLNLTKWLAFGVDYSIQFGRGTLLPSELKPAYDAELGELVTLGEAGAFAAPPPAGFGISIPTNYRLYAPFEATTQTYTAGPQLNYRHFKRITLFIHPSIGAIHENISIQSHNDPFVANIVIPALLAQQPVAGLLGITSPVLRTLRPNDTTYFYGVGGGWDYNMTKHFHLRADIEFVHVDLFSGLLANSRNSVRMSVGPTFAFGKNVAR